MKLPLFYGSISGSTFLGDCSGDIISGDLTGDTFFGDYSGDPISEVLTGDTFIGEPCSVSSADEPLAVVCITIGMLLFRTRYLDSFLIFFTSVKSLKFFKIASCSLNSFTRLNRLSSFTSLFLAKICNFSSRRYLHQARNYLFWKALTTKNLILFKGSSGTKTSSSFSVKF